MITCKNWINKNIDKLEEDYQEYLDTLDKSIVVADSFEDFCENRFESANGDYEDMEYERYKERDI